VTKDLWKNKSEEQKAKFSCVVFTIEHPLQESRRTASSSLKTGYDTKGHQGRRDIMPFLGLARREANAGSTGNTLLNSKREKGTKTFKRRENRIQCGDLTRIARP